MFLANCRENLVPNELLSMTNLVASQPTGKTYAIAKTKNALGVTTLVSNAAQRNAALSVDAIEGGRTILWRYARDGP